MSRASPSIRIFAERLIAHEAIGRKPSRPDAAGPVPVLAKLRPMLTTLMGSGGFRALLSRAVALTNADTVWMRAVHVKADGSLEGWAELATQVESEEFQQGGVTLLTHLLGLMVTFIGPTLTAHLLGEIWPKLSTSYLEWDNGEK